jgi:hypothetical protein
MNGWIAWQITQCGFRLVQILFDTGEITLTQQFSITKTIGALVQAADYFRGESVAFCVPCSAALLILLIN